MRARVAAKARRQKIYVGIGVAVLALVLAYEIPNTLQLLGKSVVADSRRGAADAAEAAPLAQAVGETLTSDGGGDHFEARTLVDKGIPRWATSAAAATPSPHRVRPLRSSVKHNQDGSERIVLGHPGGGRVARHGFIVILASIPTRNGRNDAVSFARGARRNVGGLSILNSSHSRPLRGGYWVVYSGPYPTLGKVLGSRRRHSRGGLSTAYVRELIAYK